MITFVFIGFLILSMCIALVDWRRGWLLAILCGVLQDPARKLTAGTPVVMSMSIVLVYVVVLFAAQSELQAYARDFARRFGDLYASLILVIVFMALAAVNGIATFGIENWKIPALSLFIYCIPVPAILLGYAWLQREEQLDGLFRFYALVTSVTLIGTALEYFSVSSRALGTVGIDYNMRFIRGLEVRLLSGFYRAPDIMGWHAATLTCIGVVMALRHRALSKSWPWMLAAGWGFLNCVMSGRRKAVYMVAAFAVAFVWRYARRLKIAEFFAFLAVGAVLAGVVHQVSKNADSSVYARGALRPPGRRRRPDSRSIRRHGRRPGHGHAGNAASERRRLLLMAGGRTGQVGHGTGRSRTAGAQPFGVRNDGIPAQDFAASRHP
jgi:hypothetical protein